MTTSGLALRRTSTRRLSAWAIPLATTAAFAAASFLIAARASAGIKGPLLLLVTALGGVVMLLRPRAVVPVYLTLGATVFALPFGALSLAGFRSDIPELIGLGLIGGWVARVATGFERPRGPYVVPIALFVTGAVIGTVYGAMHGVSRARLQGGLKPYLLYLVAVVLAGAYATDQQQERLQRLVLRLSTVGSAWVLVRAAAGKPVANVATSELSVLGESLRSQRYRPALLSMLTLALVLLLGLIARHGWSRGRAVQLAMFLVTILLGYNRSSWLPLALAAVLVGVLRTGPRQPFRAMRTVLALAVLAPGLFILASAGSLGEAGKSVATRMSSVVNPEVLEEGSFEDRTSENKDALRAISRSPVFGVGVAGLYGARRAAYSEDLRQFVYYDRSYVHNSYLYAWLQTGLVGVMAVALLGWRITRTAVRAHRELPPETAGRVVAAALGLLAMALTAIFQPYVLSRPTIAVLCVALALAQPPTSAPAGPGDLSAGQKPETPASPRSRRAGSAARRPARRR